MTNYDAHYPPGANADLLRIEREQEEIAQRLAEIEKEMRDDPQVIIDNLDEDEIARRLLRMLKVTRRYAIVRADADLLGGALVHEWHAAFTEAMINWRKSEGIE